MIEVAHQITGRDEETLGLVSKIAEMDYNKIHCQEPANSES